MFSTQEAADEAGGKGPLGIVPEKRLRKSTLTPKYSFTDVVKTFNHGNHVATKFMNIAAVLGAGTATKPSEDSASSNSYPETDYDRGCLKNSVESVLTIYASREPKRYRIRLLMKQSPSSRMILPTLRGKEGKRGGECVDEQNSGMTLFVELIKRGEEEGDFKQ